MRRALLTLMAGLLVTDGHATEGGGGAYGNGAETVGVAVLPPAGTYLLNYANYYSADRFDGPGGKTLIPNFSLNVYANVFRLVHVFETPVFGATLAMQAFLPIVDLKVRAGNLRGKKTGPGDIIVNPFVLGWKFGNLHVVTTMDTYLPTGRYDKDDLANIGRNHVTFEPVLAFTWLDPKGGPELSMKLMYDFNIRNRATEYRSGQEFHVDYALAYNFNPITIGVGGYYYRQTTSDRQNGRKVSPDGYKGEAIAIGPTLRYMWGAVPITAQWQREVSVRYRAKGDKYWLKAAFAF